MIRTSLRTRLMVSYATIALFSVLVLTLGANFFLESQFSQFVRERIKKEQEQTLQTLTEAWVTSGSWTMESLDLIGMAALERGFILRLKDSDDAVVWDATTHNHGLCQEMLFTMAHNMDSRYPGWNGSYREDAFFIKAPGQTTSVGTAWIGYYGPFYYNESELFFLASLNRLIIIFGFIALVVAGFFGFLMAGWLSKPLRQLGLSAHLLAGGDLATRNSTNSGVKEIADLATSFNSLAHTLGEQEFLRRRLTQDVAHELRTPLTSLQGNLEAMIDGIWPADVARLESCREEVLRLARLVGQIEGLAKVESGSSSVNSQEIDSQNFCSQLCANLQASFQAKGVLLVGHADDFTFATDSDKLSQILVNLLSNALKFTSPGGQVDLDMAVQKTSDGGSTSEKVYFTVQDTGLGISKDDLSKVFERFYRADQSRAKGSEGAGIGLTIARALAIQLGGDLSVVSEVGKGSTFTLLLPLRID